MNDLQEDLNLFKKYDIYADDYTDYPHKSNWSENLGDEEYRHALKMLFSNKDHRPTLLYVHIPFCKKLCYYCLCHKEIVSGYDKVLDHFENYLCAEIEMLYRFFDKYLLRPNFKEIYLGGGSPTILQETEFDKLVELLSRFCDIGDLNRFCVEIDPRTCSPNRLKYYHQKGVTTLSIGVQDINPEVQKAMNRIQPFELLERLLTPDIRPMFRSINFDFLVGLPMQTASSMRKTMEQILSLSPDRISLCFFHYTAKFYPHMKKLEKILPNFFERKQIFASAVEVITNSGYIRTGFEHFAKADDIVAKSIKEKKATYTSLGAITGACLNVVATGRSGHSILGDDYLFQNYYEQEPYADALSKKQFPIYRGLKLSNDDAVRRDIIRRLRTYFVVEIPYIEGRINASFKDYFQKEIDLLTEFAKDKLVTLTDKEISITEKGKYFTDLIISIFDNYLKSPRYNKEFGTSRSS